MDTVFHLLVTSTLCYFGTYLWKFTPFVLPSPLSRGISSHAVLGLAQTFGFFCGKFPVLKLVPRLKRSQRIKTILASVWSSSLLIGIGMLSSSIAIQAIAMFMSSVATSFIFATIVLYLEGRENSPLLFSALLFGTVLAGGSSRAFGALLLTVAPARYITLIAGVCGAAASSILAIWMNKHPDPTLQEQSKLACRAPMTKQQQLVFLKDRWFLVLLFASLNALIFGFRSLRDFFAVDLLSEAMGTAVPSFYLFLTELPAAVISVVLFPYICSKNRSCGRVLLLLLRTMAVAALSLPLTTVLFRWIFPGGKFGPLAWQTLQGMGLFVTYVPISGLLFDKVFALLKVDSTSVFLLVISDTCGYVGAVASISASVYFDTTHADRSIAEFYDFSTFVVGAGCLMLLFLVWLYFRSAINDEPTPAAEEQEGVPLVQLKA